MRLRHSNDFSHVPVIDVAPLVHGADERVHTAEQIGAACRESGFFYVVNHGVDESLCQRLETLSREFFAQSESQKMQIAMSRGGRAWRGYFPVGRELTSGKPDRKEGLYFGAEVPLDHPAVRAGTPLHGPNLFPGIPGFRETVLRYVDSLTALGHALMSGISLGLGLDEHYFKQRYYRDPLILFRIFNYPHSSASQSGETAWGVGEHTDYGLLTILRQDDTGGLQVKSRSRWIDAPPIPRILSLQHRRHARTSDARNLSFDSASGDQHVAARSAVVPVLFRSELRCTDAAGGGFVERGARR